MAKQNLLYAARRFFFLILTCLMSQVALSESRIYSISADDWARPRSGGMLLQLEALQHLMQDWSVAGHVLIEIHFPGGEMGNLWAEELQDWLIALGVPSMDISLSPGGAEIDRIDLVLKTRK